MSYVLRTLIRKRPVNEHKIESVNGGHTLGTHHKGIYYSQFSLPERFLYFSQGGSGFGKTVYIFFLYF